jgi:hypothetical protein
MDHGHLDAAERLHVLQHPHELVAVLERHAHLGQRAARALDALGRRNYRRVAGNHRLADLVGAPAVEHDAPRRFFPKRDRQFDVERVADVHGRVELERLARVAGAGPRQARAEHGGNQRRAPHAVRDDPGGLGGTVRRRVARHRGEQLQVGRGERALDGGAIADDDLVEGAVAKDFEVFLGKCAGHGCLTLGCGGRRRRSGCRR